MCNYKYLNKGSNQYGKACIYPEIYSLYSETFDKKLLIDKDGYCIFHSKKNKWKIENDFLESFQELIKVITEINLSLSYANRNYFFSGFHFPNYESIMIENTQFLGLIDLSFATFEAPIFFSNMEISSLNLLNSKFAETLSFNNVYFKYSTLADNSIFNNGLIFNECTIESNLLFNNCTFDTSKNFSPFELRIKSCDPLHYINFSDSVIKSKVFIRESSIGLELNFDHCIIEDEFLFEQNKVNGTVSFKETEFTLHESANPLNSTVHFENIELNKQGRIIFKGRFPQDEMVNSDLTIHFKNKPEGLILFENFNLNKLYPKFKRKIPELEKNGIVKIGNGCRKYNCETEIFKIEANKATQSLILDIVKVFCNYFALQENSNLGIEIVERNSSLIRYFYFTDEDITIPGIPCQ
ncbi:MAG: hypothetical protein ACOCUV_00065 [bacterium]